MKFKFVVPLAFISTLLITVGFSASLLANEYLSPVQKVSSTSNDSPEQLKNMATELKYYDEVLTASVLSYAFSGEDKWLIRYKEFEPKLTRLINNLLNKQRQEDAKLIAHLSNVNNVLVALENQAINAIQSGDRKGAMAIINSDEYHQNKSEYMRSLLSFITQLEKRSLDNKITSSDNNILQLTPEEQSWIESNIVTIGIEYWPPILFMQDDKTPGGLTGEILLQIIEKTGLKVDYIEGSWENILEQFRQQKLDLLPDAYMFEERKAFGNYSTPYFMVRELFYVKDSNSRYQSNINLSEASIAISQGYTTIDKVTSLYPNLKIIETSGIEESIDKVLKGEADALLDAQIVVDDWINQKQIRGLRVIDEDVVSPPSLHFLTQKNKVVLQSILQKGLDSIKASDLMNTNNKWLTTRNKDEGEIDREFELHYAAWFVVGALVVLMLIGSFISSIVLKASENELPTKFGSKRFKRIMVISLIVLSSLLIATSFFVVTYSEKHQYRSVEYSLNNLLSTAHQRLQAWTRYELSHLELIGKNKELAELVEKILLVPEDKSALLDTPIQSQIRSFFSARDKEFGHGFFIISPNKISLASSRNTNIGVENLINKSHPELLKKVLSGESVFIPPIDSDVPLENNLRKNSQHKQPTMFFASPILNTEGAVIAILTKRINFNGVFSSILAAGFIGKSGETYALDESGMLLSNVRFEDDLRRIGFIEKGERASLNMRISDPGRNLLKDSKKYQQDGSRPLTLMASQIANKKTGANLEGYRDYRGVQVIGAWRWDETMNIGLVAEVDLAESLEFLVIFKYTMWSFLFVSLLLVFGGTLFTLKIGTKANRALTRSHAELEHRIATRTRDLEINMKRTRTIIDNASDGIIVVDNEGIIQSFSPAAELIFEYSTTEIVGKNISLLMTPGFHQKFIEQKNNHQKDQSIFELIGFKKSKELVDIEVAVGESIVADEHLFTGMVRDTTLRKKAEAELQDAVLEAKQASHSLAEQIKLQQLLMDSVPIPLFYKNEEGRFLGFNKAYEEVFDVKSEDLIGLKVTDLTYLSEEDRLNYQAEDEDVIQKQKTVKKEMKIPFADGKLHDTLYWVTGFSDSKNKPAGLVGNFIDITNEKENARQLEIAVKQADEATKAKSDFLANMSHEIRTPMNAIIGMSYLALQTNLNRKQLDYVNKIHSSADALLGIINDILDFSKIEAGKLELEHTPFNLNDTLEHLVQIISHKSQEKELELLIDIDPELPVHLIGDPLRLGQILINLANNSIKFTAEGEIIVAAKVIQHLDQGVVLQFSVSDTGIGMSEEQKGRLFQSFSQADASTTRKYGGTGLGLTISKTLTELMQGEIWVDSTLGEGSQFHFTAHFGIGDQASSQNNISAKSLLNLPILIVDDSLAAREILFKLSENLGFAPTLAECGVEALEKLEEAENQGCPYKIVLADWKMPYMDGIELGEKICNDKLLSSPPFFVIVTAYDRDDMIKQAKNINLAASITKPVSTSTLLDTVLKVMGSSDASYTSISTEKLDKSTTQAIAGAKILLVEDNEINQQIAVELLTMAGLNVSVANNGQEALTKVNEDNFDAVLMDVQMPVMDGYTATQEIRKIDKFKELPIIAMTANAMTGDREKCLAAGMNDHLPKPINPQDVFKTLLKWVSPTGIALESIEQTKTPDNNNDLPHLPDFDVQGAVARIGGNIKAYRRMLKKVSASQKEAIARIRQAVDEMDYKSAELIAHTLKGVSANIGADFMLAGAENLETMLNARVEKNQALDSSIFDAQLNESEILLVKMLNTIEADSQAAQPATSQQAFVPKEVNKLLNELKTNIDNFDLVASDTLQEILRYLDTDNLSTTTTSLVNLLDAYDFEKAEALIADFEEEIAQYKESSSASTLSDEVLLEKLNTIEQQIVNFDSTVVDTVDDILDHKTDASLNSDLEKLREVLSNYDFDAGEALLADIKASCGR